MASGILAALAGGLGGYSGALDNQYKMQKEDERDKLKNERVMSLESLRASNQATLQQAGFTQQEKMAGLTESSRAAALAEERTYQEGRVTSEREYQEGAPERAYEAKQKVVDMDMAKFTEANPDATEAQLDNRYDILQGWAEITKGMDAAEAGKLRIDAFKMWDAKEPKDRDKLVAAYKNANPNSINPAEDAMLEFATLAVSGGRGRAAETLIAPPPPTALQDLTDETDPAIKQKMVSTLEKTEEGKAVLVEYNRVGKMSRLSWTPEGKARTPLGSKLKGVLSTGLEREGVGSLEQYPTWHLNQE